MSTNPSRISDADSNDPPGIDISARPAGAALSRRAFLGGLGGAAAFGAVDPPDSLAAGAARPADRPSGGLPAGKPLRVRPVLTFEIRPRREKTSWRYYGGSRTREDIDREAAQIRAELKGMLEQAEFPVELLPLSLVDSEAGAREVAEACDDVIINYACGGPPAWLERMAAAGRPNIIFVRHRSGPVYFYYEVAHWWLLRKLGDAIVEPNIGVDDIVVDDHAEVLWRLRALYGLKNARGTRCLAVGGLRAYSAPGQELGPEHVRRTWGYEIIPVPDEEVGERLARLRADAAAVAEAERAADAVLAEPGVTLGTERRFVVNTMLALRVMRELMAEHEATNLGVANCMGSLISLLDTAPCLLLALLNDEGLTAFCHTDYTHTAPGVLMRWISSRPSFVCNSHFPHDGMITFAHCSAPRRMNGRDAEPTLITTHFESDYGTADKVYYRRGQTLTCILPAVSCTRWTGFRGRVLEVPDYDMCRSQMDVAIEGDWRRLQREMQGFHTVITYGDYLREAGYALRRVGIAWDDLRAPAAG